MTHSEILSEVLAIAKERSACTQRYRRAAESTDMASLAEVLRDNFYWCCNNGLLTPDTITRWGLRDHGIKHNEDVSSGYCLASGSATVRAWGSAYIHAPYSAIECNLSGMAILRHGNTITAANGQTMTL